MYLPTYLPTHLPTNLPTYSYCPTDYGSGASPYPPTPSQLTYLSTYLPTYCPTYPSNYLLLLSNGSRIRCFTLPSTHLLPIYPHTYLPTALSTHLTTWLPNYLTSLIVGLITEEDKVLHLVHLMADQAHLNMLVHLKFACIYLQMHINIYQIYKHSFTHHTKIWPSFAQSQQRWTLALPNQNQNRQEFHSWCLFCASQEGTTNPCDEVDKQN